jgi:hypothetical protein
MEKKWNPSLSTLWITILLSIVLFQLAFLKVILVLTLLYVLILISQVFQPCEERKTSFLEYIWIGFMGILMTSYGLGLVIRLDCPHEGGWGIAPSIDLINLFLGIGLIFPITYWLFIHSLIRLKSYFERGILLLEWTFLTFLYFELLINTPSQNMECYATIPMPLMHCSILWIHFACACLLLLKGKQKSEFMNYC